MKLKAILTGLTLLILPLAFVLATSYLKEARGPYWLGDNSDADYMYLGGALSLSKLSSPGFADHPGTPVISLGALVLITAQAVQQKADLQEDVLKNPEFYLDIIYYTLLVLCAAMLVVAGGITIWLTKNLYLSLMMQLTPFLSIAILPRDDQCGPGVPCLSSFRSALPQRFSFSWNVAPKKGIRSSRSYLVFFRE